MINTNTQTEKVVEFPFEEFTLLDFLQGKRANKARRLVKELIEDGEENGKVNKSNVDTKQQAKV